MNHLEGSLTMRVRKQVKTVCFIQLQINVIQEIPD